jgi:hypothetical protein
MDDIDAEMRVFIGGKKHDGSDVERFIGRLDLETIGNTHAAREIRQRRHGCRGTIIREVLAEDPGK